jgi:predicted transposase YdaD
VELAGVRQRNLDLLGESAAGELAHIELQSTNDGAMAIRMAEYALMVFRDFDRLPEQTVLYVGQEPPRMKTRIEGRRLSFEYRIVDIRELDGEKLLDSDSVEDNIFGVLAGPPDQRAAIRRVLARIAREDPEHRPEALAELMILAGLRKIGGIIEQEARQMPILDDILDHEVLGREFKRGLAQGHDTGREQGRVEGERRLLRRLLEARFGRLPLWATQKIDGLGDLAVEELDVRFANANSLDELFR